MGVRAAGTTLSLSLALHAGGVSARRCLILIGDGDSDRSCHTLFVGALVPVLPVLSGGTRGKCSQYPVSSLPQDLLLCARSTRARADDRSVAARRFSISSQQ